MMNIVNQAWLFAKQAHGNQRDDDGALYFEAHIVPMANIFRVMNCSSEVVAAGFLHDVIEDCGVTYETLANRFGKKIADLVNEVTHEGKPDKIGYYFPRLKSKDAVIIKLADRISNLTRMGSWDIGRQEHYLKKTRFWKVSEDDKTR